MKIKNGTPKIYIKKVVNRPELIRTGYLDQLITKI